MSATILVIVQTPCPLQDDEGFTLAPGIGAIKVKNTNYIQQLIKQGDLTLVEDATPAPADSSEPEVKPQPPTSKSRINDSEQENSDG